MEAEFTKKVELLRCLERSKAQFDDLIDTGANEAFSDEDKDFMESFKKIYHMGYEQLEEFIDLIDEKGDDIDIYSVMYYVRQLFNGPMTGKTSELSVDKDYFVRAPDMMGVCGNNNTANSSIPVFNRTALDASVDIFNKAPEFIRDLLLDNAYNTRRVFNFNFVSSVYNDNTLPFIDKKPSERIQAEYDKGYNSTPHGNYLVKDIEFRHIISDIAAAIFEKVLDYLNESNYRMFEFNKFANLFSADHNLAKTFNASVKRKLTYPERSYDEDGVEEIELKEVDIETDLAGNQFDSAKRREFEFKIIGPDDEKLFKPYTIKGQLGSGEKVEEDPITD